MPKISDEKIQRVLAEAITMAKKDHSGEVANYIPELSSAPEEYTSVSTMRVDGRQFHSGDNDGYQFTLQSVAKLVLLIGMLEEFGPEQVFSWVGVEPSGRAFASISHLDRVKSKPANPLINPGAITLCGHIPGESEDRLGWLDKWMEALFGKRMTINQKVFLSERRTGDRNRALAYLMRSNGVIEGDVEGILETYFTLCSYESEIKIASHLPTLLANRGLDLQGKRIFSEETACTVISLMTTCGMYDESGAYLVRTGMPAKSGVSGLIVAVSPGRGGVAVYSPRLNTKGGSVRGHIILTHLSKALDLHFGLRHDS